MKGGYQMAYKIAKTKEDSLTQLATLVAAFEKSLPQLKDVGYNEMQLRIDFINPFLKTFGWDVDNEDHRSQFLRPVVVEESIEVEDEDGIAKKNPDYTLCVQGERKLFVEVKRVAIDVERSAKSVFQLRRYGWNANLGISILTNFEKLIVYDCRYKPSFKEDPSIARYKIFQFSTFIKEFDVLYELLSFKSVSSGYIDDYFSVNDADVSTFDDYFLRQIETWRRRLAENVISNNFSLKDEDLNFLIQRLLNRIVFLRICEDREIEKYKTLKKIQNYDDLRALFIASDKKYNSGLFDFIEDHFSLQINLRSEDLIEIFSELYYPESPYDFSVVDPSILSQIYERYLGSKITIGRGNSISITEEPEVAASDGVVPTPKHIVENIVREGLSPVLAGRTVEEIQQLRIADICCGSGTFLLSVFDLLVEKIIIALVLKGVQDDNIIYEHKGTWCLSLRVKQSILIDNIYGVDINPYAVEVTKFSLLLKLIENENAASIARFLAKYDEKVLPALGENIKTGNSLIDKTFYVFNPKILEDDALLHKIKPFSWWDEFPFVAKAGGFDAIVGNPPYVRIQNMVKYQVEEVGYFQNDRSGYKVAGSANFDKYYLFIQRAFELLGPNGVLSYIVPNKFFTVKGGGLLRDLITGYRAIYKIIHFGVTQIFPRRSTYTAVLILDKKKREQFYFKRIKKPLSEFIAGAVQYVSYDASEFTSDPWIFVSKDTQVIFDKMRASGTIPLKNVADIAVGLQTSADAIYIFKPLEETANSFIFESAGIRYEIEKGICQPCLFKLNFDLFDTVSPNAQMIFPYKMIGNKAEVLSEEEFSQNFPLAWAYLSGFRALLEKRSITGTKGPKWYQFGRSQNLTRFLDARKLIWPVLSTESSYIYDENNLKFTGGGNGPYYSLISKSQYSLLYILGVLSHPVIEAMVKAGASEFRGAYYSHGKQFIENLPIKRIVFSDKRQTMQYEEIVKTVAQLIEAKNSYHQLYLVAKKNDVERKINFLRDKLIGFINELYGISGREVATVLSDEMFLTDLTEN